MLYEMMRWCTLLSLSNKITLLSKGPCTHSRRLYTLPLCASLNSKRSVPNLQVQRNTSFFNKLPAQDLWKGVISVSNAGKKRGRGKGAGRKMVKNLNRGQIIGIGKANIVWPGLTVPVLRGRELVQQQKLPEDPEHTNKLIKLRDAMGSFKSLRFSPLERGWSGSKYPGRSIGPPDPVGEDTFEGFDTKVLEFKMVVTMKGNLGRKRRLSALVVTGNGNGLAGFAYGKALEGRAALHTARNRAGQKLMFIERYNNHTVYHDFYSQFGKTKVFVSKRAEGHGLVCHRAIKTICEVVGIKDLHAKIEGPTNLQHIIKAFFLGLLEQKTHESLAEEKQLHLVELRKENSYYPRVVASPTVCRTVQDIPADEVLDYTQHVMGNRVVLKKKKWPPFYTKLPSYQTYMKKAENMRNHDKVRIQLQAEYGEVCSFLTDKYPECRQKKIKPQGEEASSEESVAQ